jgi:hypothetical protein
METTRQIENRKESRPHNRRLAQWRVQWLIEHSTSHKLLWCIDSFVLRNPQQKQNANPLCTKLSATEQLDGFHAANALREYRNMTLLLTLSIKTVV